MALRKWKEIYKLKECGDLGFRSFQQMNLTLLSNADKLWTQIHFTKILFQWEFYEHNLHEDSFCLERHL